MSRFKKTFLGFGAALGIALLIFSHIPHQVVATEISELIGYTGLIGNEDINWGTGEATDTFSVAKPGGGTLTLTKVPALDADTSSIIKGAWYVATEAELIARKDLPGVVIVAAPIPLTENLTTTCGLYINRGCPITATGFVLTENGPHLSTEPYQQYVAVAGEVKVAPAYSGNIRPEHFGADPTGVADSTAAIQAHATALLVTATATTPNTDIAPVVMKFSPGAKYKVSSTVQFNLPASSEVDARGVKFTFTHDGVGFDLNPPLTANMPRNDSADTYTKRDLTWRGGYFTSSSATTLANCAIQAYYFRNIRFENVRIQTENGATPAFHTGILFGGKDTYRFIDCYISGAKYHYRVPAEGTLYTAANIGNALVDAEWRGCNSTLTSTDMTLLVEDTFHNLKWYGGNSNGAAGVAHMQLVSGSVTVSDGFLISGTHFEQMAAGAPAVQFVDTGTQGFKNINFDGGFTLYTGTAGWQGVELANCQYVRFGTGAFINAVTYADFGVWVDDDSRNILFDRTCEFRNFLTAATVAGTADNGGGLIRIETTAAHNLSTGDRIWMTAVTGTTNANGMWLVTYVDSTHFDLQASTYAGAWTGGGYCRRLNAVKVESVDNRQNITVLPEITELFHGNLLANYDMSAGKSSASGTTVYMAHEMTNFVVYYSTWPLMTYLWPKGYYVYMSARDSGSAGGAAQVDLYNSLNAAVGYNRLTLNLAGQPNDHIDSIAGYVNADRSGNLMMTTVATGAGTLDIAIGVTAIRQ